MNYACKKKLSMAIAYHLLQCFDPCAFDLTDLSEEDKNDICDQVHSLGNSICDCDDSKHLFSVQDLVEFYKNK